MATQSNVLAFGFISDNLPRCVEAQRPVAFYQIDTAVEGNLVEVNDMLEIPTHDGAAA